MFASRIHNKHFDSDFTEMHTCFSEVKNILVQCSGKCYSISKHIGSPPTLKLKRNCDIKKKALLRNVSGYIVVTGTT